MNAAVKSWLGWLATVIGGILLGLIAAHLRLLDSTVAVVVLAAIVIALIVYGVVVSRQIWRDDDD